LSMPGISEAAKERFYARNFVDLFGVTNPCNAAKIYLRNSPYAVT